MRTIAAADAETELAHEGTQGFQLFRRRSFVYAVKRRMLVRFEKIRSADIGRQHALLDQPVRFVAADRLDTLDLAIVVEHHHGFSALKLDRAAFFARLDHDLVKRVKMLHVRHQPGMFARGFSLRMDDHVVHLGIRHARLRAHH